MDVVAVDAYDVDAFATAVDGARIALVESVSNPLLRECDIPASLSSTAIGKDYRGLIGAGVTSEGTGVQLETPIIGLKLGLKEGVEVHILGLSLGIDLWPPAIIVPIGEGRIGFGDR